jgi:hypothetical protein
VEIVRVMDASLEPLMLHWADFPVDAAASSPRSHLKPLRIPQIFDLNSSSQAWLGTLSDLDAADRRASENELLLAGDRRRANLGARIRALARARWIAGTTLVVAAFGIWGMFVPDYAGLTIVLLTALPWVVLAIGAASHGLFAVNDWRNDAHPSLAPAIVIPALVLAVTTLKDYSILKWDVAIAVSVAGGVFFAMLLGLVDRSVMHSARRFVLILPFAIAYCFGVIGQANARPDSIPPTIFRVAVAGKYWSSGRTKIWYLRLASTDALTVPADVSVPGPLWEAVRVGDTVCVNLHAGALRINWFTVGQCQ